MSKKRDYTKYLSIRKAIIIGILLFLTVTMITGHIEAMSIKGLAENTMDTLKQQCVSFNKIIAADRTKSLFRLTDMMKDFSNHLAEESVTINDEYLERYVDGMRITGIAILNKDLKLEASGYTRQFRNTNWELSSNGSRYTDIILNPSKIFAERVEVDGEYYDIAAVSRKDAKGIVIGFYQQPSGIISGTENDLESLLTGLHLESSGHYIIIEDGNVRATSDKRLKDKKISDSVALRRLSQIPKDKSLHLVHAQGKYYWGYRSGCEGYVLCIYYPFTTIFSVSLPVGAILTTIYFILWCLYFSTRNRVLYKNQEKLKESNQKLTETVEILRSLETIYFTLFYVDLEHNSYKTIYIAPWLEKSIPEKGVYTQLKQLFLDMVVPSFRKEVDYRMSSKFIKETLSQENITDVRKSFYTDYQAIRGDEIKWCRVSATVVDYDSEGKPAHILALLQDVNKEKTKEEAYQNKILEEAYAAKVANGAKTEFLRRISHDIRTPINGIQGYINLGANHPNDPVIQEYCRKSANAALHTLLELVNSVLEMSKLESDEISLEHKAFNLEELLAEINTILKPQAESRNICYKILRTEDLPINHLIGSPRHISQILMNLVSNAVKYGKNGGYIRLNTHLISSNEEEVTYEFCIEDDGIGMSETFQEHLFEPFMQEAKTARTTYMGCGLGLSIVKKLLDALGGNIVCESKKDVGTKFLVQLTFQINKDYHDNTESVEEVRDKLLNGKNILLVEDNELNMEIAQIFLEEQGVNVENAWNGQEAVDIFKNSEEGFFDFIIMDIMMPVMNGFDATRTIRALDRADAKTVPIIAMSANAFEDDVKKSMEAGMNIHVSKPVEERKLLAAVERVMVG